MVLSRFTMRCRLAFCVEWLYCRNVSWLSIFSCIDAIDCAGTPASCVLAASSTVCTKHLLAMTRGALGYSLSWQSPWQNCACCSEAL